MATLNPYAAPSTAAIESPPRRPYIAMTIVVGLVLASGFVLRIGSLASDGLLGVGLYQWMYWLHIAAESCAASIALACIIPTSRRECETRIAAAFLFAASALIRLLLQMQGWSQIVANVTLVVASLLLARLALLSDESVSARLLALVAVAGCAWRTSSILDGGWESSVAALIVVSLVFMTSDRGTVHTNAPPRPTVPALVCAMCAVLPVQSLLGCLLLIAWPTAAAVVVWRVLRQAQSEETGWSRTVRALQVLFFLEGLLLAAFLRMLSIDVHLTDTYFVVGVVHLLSFSFFLGLVRLASRHLGIRSGWTGLTLTAVGAEVFACACLVVGSRGMPRRYTQYLPQFEPLHRVASVGAFIALAGVVLLMADAFRSRKNQSAGHLIRAEPAQRSLP